MIAIVGVHQKLGLVNCLRSFGASGLRLPLGIHVESLKSQLLKTMQKKLSSHTIRKCSMDYRPSALPIELQRKFLSMLNFDYLNPATCRHLATL